MRRTRRGRILALGGGLLGLSASAAMAATIESGVAGLKLVILDKYASGKAKAVYVAKGAAGIAKGPDGDPSTLSGTVRIFPLSNPANAAVYDLPSPWLVNKPTVAKRVDKAAAPGGAGAKVVVIKPGLVGKLVAKNLGDGDGASGDQSATDLDLQALTDADTVRVVVTTNNANDGNTYVFCSDFSDLSIKKNPADLPFKVLSKSSTAPASCGVCGDGVLAVGEQCDDGNNIPGDGCNQLCETEAGTCAPAIGTRTVTVSIDTPVPLAALRLDLEYPQIHTSIPGMGNSSLVNSRVTVFPTGGNYVVNDRDTDLTVVLANATAFIDSGDVYRVDFDECTPIGENMCNRAQNVIGCCDDPANPAQFPDVCQNKECTNLPGTVCTSDGDCGGTPGTCQPKPCTSDASCTGGFGTCVFKCPANPPVCPLGLFPDSSIGTCACAATCGADLDADTTAAGDDVQLIAVGNACPSANACVVGLGPNNQGDTYAASGDTGVAGGCPGDNVCVSQLSQTTCSVSSPADEMGDPVEGVTCTITVASPSGAFLDEPTP
jgi:cysteine-rich repeat protein